MAENRKVKVTVLRRFSPSEVFGDKLPVTPVDNLGACEAFKDGQEFIVDSARMPADFPCSSAWQSSIYWYVRAFLWGAEIPGYKESSVVVPSCIDGLRPVIFKVERV